MRLSNILGRFDEANLQLHPRKCDFAKSQVQYLGYILSENGISASPEKVKAVRQYRNTKIVSDVRAFLGLASFYRRLVPNFAEIVMPLSQLTRKGQKFIWGRRQLQAFEGLKERPCTTPVLAYPNFKLPFILITDANRLAIEAILSGVQDGVERPLTYASRQLNNLSRLIQYVSSNC